jgi:hypothetical protein
MTTPAPAAQPERMSAAEIRKAFDDINARLQDLYNLQAEERERVEQIAESVESIIEGLHKAAATLPPTAPSGQTLTETATSIERETRKGKTYYRVMCGRFTKHGVRIWEEGLKAAGIDPAALDWVNDTAKIDPPLRVVIEMENYTTEEGETKTGPKRIIGKAQP